MNTKTLDRGTQRYEAPSLEIIELNTENVICQASMTPADWQKGEEDWFE